jgi:adenylyltransferase/sulfurtransferase
VDRFTDEEVRRYGRQMILPEVGGIGQARLRAASATALDEVEALYLAGAGVGAIVVPDATTAERVRALNPRVSIQVAAAVRHCAPAGATHDVERSAERALETLRTLLGL